MLELLRKSVESRMEERVKDLQDVALKRLTQVLTDDRLYEASPFQVVDRGLKVLQGTGVLRSDAVAGSGGIHAKNAIFIGSEAADTIREGLKAADEANRLHSGNGEKVEKQEIILDAPGT